MSTIAVVGGGFAAASFVRELADAAPARGCANQCEVTVYDSLESIGPGVTRSARSALLRANVPLVGMTIDPAQPSQRPVDLGLESSGFRSATFFPLKGSYNLLGDRRSQTSTHAPRAKNHVTTKAGPAVYLPSNYCFTKRSDLINHNIYALYAFSCPGNEFLPRVDSE